MYIYVYIIYIWWLHMRGHMPTISHPKSLYVESKDFKDRKGSSYERIALIALQRWSQRLLFLCVWIFRYSRRFGLYYCCYKGVIQNSSTPNYHRGSSKYWSSTIVGFSPMSLHIFVFFFCFIVANALSLSVTLYGDVQWTSFQLTTCPFPPPDQEGAGSSMSGWKGLLEGSGDRWCAPWRAKDHDRTLQPRGRNAWLAT